MADNVDNFTLFILAVIGWSIYFAMTFHDQRKNRINQRKNDAGR